jgi:hypothetical protein
MAGMTGWQTTRSPMLSQVWLGKVAAGREEMDLHRHATFACSLSRFFARMASLWRR